MLLLSQYTVFFTVRCLCQKCLENLDIWNDVIKLVNFIKQRLVYPGMVFEAVCKPGQRVHIFYAACRNPGVYQRESSQEGAELRRLAEVLSRKIEG